MLNNILCLDVSKRSTGWYCNNNTYGLIKTTKADHGDSEILYNYIISNILKLIKDNDVKLVLMEDGFSFGKNKQETQKLVELRACIKYILFENKIGYVTYAPTVIKKQVTGKGNSKKEQVFESIRELHKYDKIIKELEGIVVNGKNKNDDIFDAIAIYETYLRIK